MQALNHVKLFLRITGSRNIMRRYFVVNGFDGALTMLGLIIGFLLSAPTDLAIVINVCLAAAIALGMSGLSSAYISEVAERKRELLKLEEAMVTDLEGSAHSDAASLVPWLIALVNGFAPFVISVLIIVPLWLAQMGIQLAFSPLYSAIAVALALIFFLGIFLGRISGIAWFRSGFQTMLVAMVVAVLIYLLTS